MKYAIIAAETVCAIVMLIIGYAVIVEKTKKLSTYFFICCVFSIIAVLLCDDISYIAEGHVELTLFLYIVNVGTFIAGDILMLFFAWYVWSIVNEKQPIKKTTIYIVYVVSAIDIVFQLYCAITHQSIIISNGYFVAGPLYDYCFIGEFLVMFICMVHLIANIKILGKQTIIVFALYYFFPVISIIIILFNPDVSFICSSISLSFLIIYVKIEKETRDILMNKMLHTDILTNLLNRNAYEERVAYYSKDESNSNIGVIFCDVNGLKYVNDKFGHAEGDKLIIRFANVISNSFNKYETFRISGDEFVIFMYGVDKDFFNNKYTDFRLSVSKEEYIASCGCSYGNVKDISSLIVAAEKQMYDDKEVYYEKNQDKNRRRVKLSIDSE